MKEDRSPTIKILQTGKMLRAATNLQALEIIKHHWQNKKLVIHNCHKCDYPCGFIIKQEKIFYDSGCDCLDLPILEDRTDDDLLRVIGSMPEVFDAAFESEKIFVV